VISLDSFVGLEAVLAARREEVQAALQLTCQLREGPVATAACDALFAPAKRLRPVLTLLVGDVFQAPHAALLGGACAVEMVHTASLILDDLPSMDGATERRGRPACHIAHGEATAILAAFALINRAFDLLASGWPEAPDATTRGGMARELAQAIGLDGMIAGQAMDLAMTDRATDLKTLEYVHSRKTGALFTVSAVLGTLVSRVTVAERVAIAAYAKNLGLAFQIVDDLIDATGDAAASGKNVRQDERKTTFVSFAGVAGARQLAAELIEASQDALRPLGPRAEPLRELARYVIVRKR
jgi:geranylgeranyl pyrophosphate synthase